MRYLDEEQLLLIHGFVVEETGGSHGVRDMHAIRSTAELPKQQVFGVELYPTVFDKAAVYTRNIITAHPFLDGNKRTGMTAAIVFLEKNGQVFTAPKGEVARFALEIVSHKHGIPKIAAWLRKNSKKRS